MRLMRFSFSISHVPGKDFYTADALSRAPISDKFGGDQLSGEEVDAYVQMAVQCLPATEKRLEVVRSHQERDSVCKQVITYCQDGWPSKSDIPTSVKPFHSVAGELSVHDGLLMRGSRIVIPTDMQSEVLAQVHTGHQGISKSRLRARQSVWWPGMSTDLEKLVTKCSECAKCRVPRAEPLLSTPMPTLPWQRVATDLFEWKKTNYLLVIDYFSRWIEIAKLEQASSTCIIEQMKSIFARHGIAMVQAMKERTMNRMWLIQTLQPVSHPVKNLLRHIPLGSGDLRSGLTIVGTTREKGGCSNKNVMVMHG